MSTTVVHKGEEDATQIALAEHIVLWRIFSYLKGKELKPCRLVSKFWRCEVDLYVQKYRKFYVSIRTDDQYARESVCSKLKSLNEFVSTVPSITIINGLEIRVQFSHDNCASQVNVLQPSYYDQLLEKLPLKYLDITWNPSNSGNPNSPPRCPAIEFIRSILCQDLSGLHSLGLRISPGSSSPQFPFKDWVPVLTELKVLDLGSGAMWTAEPEFVQQVISAASNLKSLRGTFGSNTLERLPKSAYKLLKSFSLCSFSSAQEEKNCLEFAEAGPALSILYVAIPSSSSYSQRQLAQSFFGISSKVLEKLLKSSCHSLIEFQTDLELFPLHCINFPIMHNLGILRLVSQDRTSRQIDILKSINYPKLLPSLSALWLMSLEHLRSFVPAESQGNQLENHGAAANGANYSSSSVKEIVISGDLSLLNLHEFSRIFPNVTSIRMTALAVRSNPVLYEDLWAAWPGLENIDVREPEEALGMNYDSQFLGIHPEGVDCLRKLDDESLGKINIVPVRPSILTMSRLKVLKIGICLRFAVSNLPHDQVFLSKVTGILAFKKMTRKGVKIEFVEANSDFPCLYHLREFTSGDHLHQ